MKILFNNCRNAFLPEIYEYSRFFKSKGYDVSTTSQDDIKKFRPDIYWDFMGFDFFKSKKIKIIHEYLSGSTGSFYSAKNFAKTSFNTKPNHRFFLNNYVHDLFHFPDKIPYSFRDMGVSEDYFVTPVQSKHGIICIANKSSERILSEFLKLNKTLIQEIGITIAGPISEQLKKEYKKNSSIRFLGIIPYKDIPNLIMQFEYGVVFYDDIDPYRHQTSTRILEFSAARLKIISTPLPWIQNFFHTRDGNFLDFSKPREITKNQLEKFDFSTPEVSDYRWERIFEKADILNTVQKILND